MFTADEFLLPLYFRKKSEQSLHTEIGYFWTIETVVVLCMASNLELDCIGDFYGRIFFPDQTCSPTSNKCSKISEADGLRVKCLTLVYRIRQVLGTNFGQETCYLD
jgi:hypothetical protein